MRLLKITPLLIAITLISGCSCVNSKAKLNLPPELVIPQSLKIQAEEIKGLTDKTVDKLIKRDKLKDARIDTLQNIIKSTH